MGNSVVDIVERAIEAQLSKKDYSEFNMALAVISALEKAGKRIVDREPSPGMIEAGLTSTAVRHAWEGSQLQVNRQKMAHRFRAMWDHASTYGDNK